MNCDCPPGQCPACDLRVLLEEFKKDGATPGVIMPMFFAVLMEVFPDTDIHHIEIEASEVSIH